MNDSMNMSKIIDLINPVFLFWIVKLVDPAIFLTSWTEISSYCKALSWLISLVDQIKPVKSMNNSLNSVLLYRKLVDWLKI